jgi:tetratricopeptide (TPR) repeat protein
VAGIQPKIVCAQCGSVLTRMDTLCPSCGTAVDWTDGGTSVAAASQNDFQKKEAGKNKQQGKTISSAWGSKIILGTVAVVALVIIAYEVLDDKRPAGNAIQQPMSTPVQLPAEIQELENSVAANPDDMSLTLQLANAYHDKLLYVKAIPYYKTYLQMNPKDADARVDMGICFKELGNFKEAENEMRAALQYVPNHLNAHFNLGIIYLNEGNLEESNTWFKRTVALDPGSEVGKRAQQLLTQHNSQITKK